MLAEPAFEEPVFVRREIRRKIVGFGHWRVLRPGNTGREEHQGDGERSLHATGNPRRLNSADTSGSLPRNAR